MHLYKFRRGSEAALTRDPDGENLPGGAETWTFVKDVVVHHAEDADRIGGDYHEITKGIADNGFYVWVSRTGTET